MLASPTSFESMIPTVIHWITVGFLVISAALCSYLYVRRHVRNILDRKRRRHNQVYDELIGLVLNDQHDEAAKKNLLRFRGLSSALSRSMLNVFRNVRGGRAAQLCELVSNSELEQRIIRATGNGTRGYRMRALQILSYLESEQSLEVIRGHLKSGNRYERLTAARALTRRKSYSDFSSIVASLAVAFPNRTDLLAEIIVKFGSEIQPALECVFRQSKRTRVRVTCLDALQRLSPARTALNLSELMHDASPAVRAGAVSLSAICADEAQSDLLLCGLADESISVKIASAKVAAKTARPDAAPLLYELSKDPHFWVRYWSMRAMWGLGKTGRQMVNAIATSNEAGRIMASNVASEMEAAHG